LEKFAEGDGILDKPEHAKNLGVHPKNCTFASAHLFSTLF
jgi:hypothetical protein